ncbi:MAG: hypothetical protein P8X39_05395, partial [Desulfofustis sp.]
LFFAESTYGLKPAELAKTLRDDSFEEREVLLSLVLSPGYGMRQAIEPLLADSAVPVGSPDQLSAAVSQRIESLTFRLPGGEAQVLEVGREEITYLIDKLYLDRTIEPTIDAALRRIFSPETLIDARLVLRCRGDTFSPVKLDFLVHFIECCGSFEDSFIELFSFLLTLIAEAGEDDSIENHLRESSRGIVETIKKIRIFEEKRERYSMEYLMMQRYPVPHESEDEMLKQLRLLSTITETILGLPPEPTLRLNHKELGRYRSTADIEQLINDLS